MGDWAIIPARGGSRRIPGKNKRLFHGKPIIEYSVEAAQESGLFERIIVTTDDIDIARIAMRCGVEPMARSEAMAEDGVGTQEVTEWILRCDSEPVPEYACCIYATSPLMSVADLLVGRVIMRDYDCDFAMSVGAYPLRDAAQFYWGKRSAFLEEVPLISEFTVMVPVAEARICDINTEEDWHRAEIMYKALYPDRPA
jgi:pseudaminic acid cytidylyltransferase